MPDILKTLPLFVLLLAILGGCASTPQASRQRDAEAKQFLSHPATSAIYVYRTDTHPDEADMVLYINGRLIGATLQRSFFRIDVTPGVHHLNGMGHDQGSLIITTRPDQVYYVELSVLGGTSYFNLVPPQIARAKLTECCELMENWAPGQRPLLH